MVVYAGGRARTQAVAVIARHAVRVGLVSTGQAARVLGVHVRTLQRWAEAGLITPDLVTPGGHMRWDVDRLREELRAMQRREE